MARDLSFAKAIQERRIVQFGTPRPTAEMMMNSVTMHRPQEGESGGDDNESSTEGESGGVILQHH